MKITITGMGSVTPDVYNFIMDRFAAGHKNGNFPTWRNGPTNEEMIAVASHKDSPIGFATFYHWQPPDMSEIVWLDLLWVDADSRRNSVGTHLMGAVIAYGERHGLPVEFATLHGNTVMQKMAKSFGLEPYTVGYRKAPIATCS